jgi:hypothetical protein
MQSNQCKVCNEQYGPKFVADFVDGICLPCQVQASHEQWEKDIETELKEVNRLLSSNYDFNSFCHDCWVCPEKIVHVLTLSSTPNLLDVYEREICNKQEYYNTINEHAQRSLF